VDSDAGRSSLAGRAAEFRIATQSTPFCYYDVFILRVPLRGVGRVVSKGKALKVAEDFASNCRRTTFQGMQCKRLVSKALVRQHSMTNFYINRLITCGAFTNTDTRTERILLVLLQVLRTLAGLRLWVSACRSDVYQYRSPTC
jgi:hypothetical protein